MTEKPTKFTVFQKQADAFLPQQGQMPTNLNKILHTCKASKLSNQSRKFVSKNGDIPNICLNQYGIFNSRML